MSDMNWREHRGRVIAMVMIVLLACSAMASRTLADDTDGKLMVVADFKDASPLLEGNDVRIKGVRVGTIASITESDRGARVLLELDREALPVHEDSSATIRPVSLLGERYIELNPGTPGKATLEDGDELKPERVTAATDLDEVLNMIDSDTGDSLAALVVALGTAMDGNGEQVDAALKALLPAMRDSKEVTQVLEEQNMTLDSLVVSLEKVAGGLADDEGKTLDTLVSTTQQLLDTTAVNEVALRQTIAELPATLKAARRTVGQLESAASQATPTLEKLRPLTDNLDEVSKELLAFADAAEPALTAANPVLDKADTLLEEARPVAKYLRAMGPELSQDLSDVEKITARVAPEMTMIMEFVRGWALTTNGRDGLGHYFRGMVVLDDGGAALGLIPSTEKKSTKKPSTSQSPKKKPGLLEEGGLDGLLDGVLNLPKGLLSSKTDKQGSVTGLTPEQEFNVLHYLLGGK